MTTPQERVADAVRRGQETVNSTVRTMTDGLEWLVSSIDITSTVPTLDELVDRSYTFGVQVLAAQRDFTKSLLSYATPLTDTLYSAPRKAEQFIMRNERAAAKKAETVAAKAEDITAQAEQTATKAQRSTAARARSAASKN
ncbi:MAG TPA: hypothetical protein VGH27_02035 [Streptosporangiaceae bacterium]|jgi:hypothetical protein